ncbi:relaxase domain-containing protein [Humibacter albus]|uniref:relaxase domain-containing protein n=1 Tax=Humibacter albus TaxID=427754 RepID=UPI00316AE279
MGRHPITGVSLGLAYPAYKTVAERIGERVAAFDPEFGPPGRAEAVAAIDAEEQAHGTRRAVAGYDYPFSIPKSASVRWAVADADTQALIADAHHAAGAEMVALRNSTGGRAGVRNRFVASAPRTVRSQTAHLA